MSAKQALWAVIAVSTVLRLALAGCMGGVIDEAYYVLYGQNLDWAFFDHPPMTGVVAAVGARLAGWVSPVMGLRIGFIGMFAGSTWLTARLTERFFDARSGVLAAVVLNSTLFYGLLVGTTAGPDGPLLFFWLLTLDRLAVALGPDGRTSSWLGVGFAWGLAMLSKYHAILLPAGAVLYLVIRPAARRCLKTPGPYLATVVGLAMFAPVVRWNASHGWASFLFHTRRSGGFKGFRPEYVLEAVAGQVAYLFPWLWVGLLIVLVQLVRKGVKRWGDGEAFLVCQFVPAVGLFMGIATFSRIMTHWPLIGFVALMPVLGRELSKNLADHPVLTRNWLISLVATPVVLAALFAVQWNFGVFQGRDGRLLGLIPSRLDPTVDSIRWDQIAAELTRRGLCDDPKVFLFTDNWRFGGQLALATGMRVPVACFHRDARSFSFWSGRNDWVGRDGVFVQLSDGVARGEFYAPWFRTVERIAEFPITRAGCALQTVRLYRCSGQTSPFPFGYYQDGPMPIPGKTPGFEPDGRVMIGLAPGAAPAGKKTR